MFVRGDGLPRWGYKMRGRHEGLAIDARGALLIADDVGNVVWRVTGR